MGSMGNDRNLVFVLGDARFECLEVVQRKDQRFPGIRFGTPAEEDVLARVANPLPALTSNASTWPW